MKYTIDITLKNRDLFLQFLEKIPLEVLNKIPQGFNNNIFWNIKHTVITQQLLVYGLSGVPMNVSEEEITKYRKGSAPEGDVTQEEIDVCKSQLHTLINKTEEDLENGLFVNYKEYTVTTKTTLSSVQDALVFNNFHEGIHLGYILALKRALGV